MILNLDILKEQANVPIIKFEYMDYHVSNILQKYKEQDEL